MLSREQIERTLELEHVFVARYLSEQANCRGGWKDFSKTEGSSLFREPLSELPYLRRLDSFAMLFEYITSCAGVTLIGEDLVFVANKLTTRGMKGFNRNKLNSIVTEVMKYFSLLAAGNQNLKELREQTFKLLCTHERIYLGLIKGEARITVKSADVDTSIGSILSGDELTTRDLLHLGYSPDKALVHHIVLGLYRNFKYIENFISETARKMSDLSPKERALFAAIHNNRVIFLPEPMQNVHVELQLAGYLIDEAEKQSIRDDFFYLGLSKLCCLDCNSMLFAINRASVESNKIVFLTRGWNNIKQPWDNPLQYWEQQFGVRGAYLNKVRELYTEKSVLIQPSTEVDITGAVSDSETSSVSGFEIIKKTQLEKLQNTKEILSASSLSAIMSNKIVVLAYIGFVEFIFNGEALEEYYSRHVVNEVDGEEEMLALELLSMLEHCKQNKELLDKLTPIGLYNPGSGAFNRGFITSVLQDEVFIGGEIAEHFKSKPGVFDGLGTIVANFSTQEQQRDVVTTTKGSYLPAYTATASSAQSQGYIDESSIVDERSALVNSSARRRQGWCCSLL